MVPNLSSTKELHDVCEGSALRNHYRQLTAKRVAWRGTNN